MQQQRRPDRAIVPFGGGQRLVFRDHADLVRVLRRLETDQRVRVFSYGRNRFADSDWYPFYAYVTRGAKGAPLTAEDVEYLSQALGPGGPATVEPTAGAEGSTLSRPESGAQTTTPAPPQSPASAVDLDALEARLAPRLAELEQRLRSSFTATLTELVDKIAGVAEGQQALQTALREVTDAAAVRDLEERARRAEAECEDAKELVQIAESERDDRIRELEYVRKELDELTREHERLRSSQAHDPFDLPTDLVAMIELLQRWYPDRVLWHPRTLDDARTCSVPNMHKVTTVARVWKILQSIPTTLYELVFVEGCAQLEDAYQERTGFELALREGEQTNEDPKIMAHRKVEVDGKTIECRAHLKLGPNLRVHVHFDHERRVIVVGRCGAHLPTAGTKHLH